MTSRTIIALIASIATVTPLFGQGSHVRLEGSRLKRMLKSGGASEAGRSVAFVIPPKVLPIRVRARGRFVRFRWRGLDIEVEASNPYWVQTSRKLRKACKGKVLVKGRIRSRRTRDRKITHRLVIHAMQRYGHRAKRKKK